MQIGKRAAREIFDNLTDVDSSLVHETLEKELQEFNRKIVVLDDDPTGVQTVHGVSVYTDWSMNSIEQGFREKQPMFFILTNSRGMIASESEAAHREIAENVAAVSKKLNQPFVIVSRGDSTLRGHYPLETETLKETIEARSDLKFDGEVIIPFFKEGGRFTVDNIHYVQYGDELVPAGETEFAKDRTFGYSKSHLGEWVEEKSGGRYKAENATYISLEDIRAFHVDRITDQLLQVSGFNKVIVNAVDYADVEIFTIALIRAMKAGKAFAFRSAAAFTKVVGGIGDKPLLTREELIREDGNHGGLIVVGSHVKKTTEQLEQLKQCSFIEFIRLDSHLVAERDKFQVEVDRVISEVEKFIASGKTVTVYTRRERLDLGEGKQEEELKLSVKISDAVTSIVQRLRVRPSYIVAKGGITSSDIGTKGLQVKRATVAGQIKPGIPVWITGEESKFPGIAYVIFPGNVGAKTTLRETVELLENK
ncbi:four-carbon acid sugar kinase family protein [Paenibacillus thermotolerans]|uniref:four-carbon acid sugar kinase family protein n=1 Tax=Paenibacillus thermotolerans TaxID=3027807 RepID=UPI0023685155|nr:MULTISPECIES: four-carbon acid sugar kinase family protein [unclassified Paenibacillus]